MIKTLEYLAGMGGEMPEEMRGDCADALALVMRFPINPDPCPVCSGQRREADGTFSVRTPILDYVREVLRDLIADYNGGRITPDTMRDCLAVLEKEMADAAAQRGTLR